MAIYEFYCEPCHSQFEQITSSTDPEQGQCPQCKSKNTRKLPSRFAIGGQGDQRESTLHGCHDCHVPHRDSSGEPHDHS